MTFSMFVALPAQRPSLGVIQILADTFFVPFLNPSLPLRQGYDTFARSSSPQSTEIHPPPKKNAIILTHLKKNILSFESPLKESQEAKNKKRMFNRQISPLFCFHFEQWIIFFHHLFHISTFKVNY